MLDYKAIACLKQVIESKSFEKAGEVLGLTQSAVSQKIKKLELTYGAPLLLREKPVTSTDMGRRLLAHFAKVELMEQDLFIEGKNDTAMKKISVGINNDSLATWMMPALRELITHENIRLDVKVADQSQTRNLLQKGEVMAGISDVGTPVVGADSYFLGTLRYVLVSTPDYFEQVLLSDTSTQALAKANTLLFDENDTLWGRYQEEVLKSEIDTSRCHRLPSSQGFIELLLSGMVCAIVPRIQIEKELAAGVFIELLPDQCLSVPLFWHWYKLDSEAIDKLTVFVKQQASLALD